MSCLALGSWCKRPVRSDSAQSNLQFSYRGKCSASFCWENLRCWPIVSHLDCADLWGNVEPKNESSLCALCQRFFFYLLFWIKTAPELYLADSRETGICQINVNASELFTSAVSLTKWNLKNMIHQFKAQHKENRKKLRALWPTSA